jgi:chromosome segregation ATPase
MENLINLYPAVTILLAILLMALTFAFFSMKKRLESDNGFLEGEIQTLKDHVEYLTTRIKEKDHLIGALNIELDKKLADIHGLKETLKLKDEQLVNLSRLNNQVQGSLSDANEILAEKNVVIEELNITIQHKDEDLTEQRRKNKNLTEKIRRDKNMYESRKESLIEQRAAYNKIHEENTQMKKTIEELEKQVKMLELKIHRMPKRKKNQS